jgi:peptidoglycan-associated lipoprotein
VHKTAKFLGGQVNNRKKQWILAVLLSSVLALVVGCGKKKTPPPPPPPPKPVTATLSANPTSIQRGQSATLTWSTDAATDVTLEGNKVDPSGSQTVSPTDTTTYHLSAKGASGTQDATATITVTAPPPPPTPTPAPPPPPPATLTVTDIYFDYDKADLRPESQAALSQIAQLMSQNPNWKVKIEGNCDDRGSAMYNLALGERRANAAMQALTQAGVPASQLQAVSYGKEKPVCTDAKEDCWQKNRHDHFALQP